MVSVTHANAKYGGGDVAAAAAAATVTVRCSARCEQRCRTALNITVTYQSMCTSRFVKTTFEAFCLFFLHICRLASRFAKNVINKNRLVVWL